MSGAHSTATVWPGRDYMALAARCPVKGIINPNSVRFSMTHMQKLARGTNPAKVWEMRTMVPEVLENPRSIWVGLMRDTGEDEGFCYAGIPSHQYVGKGERRNYVPEKSIFMVFINNERTIHEWYWDDIDPLEQRYPRDYQARFKANLL